MTTAMPVARAASWLREQLPLRGPAWIREQRWFGGKARHIDRIDVEDIFWLSPGGPPTALVVLVVHQDDEVTRTADRYALIVGFGERDHGASPIGLPGAATAAEVSAHAAPLRALLAGLSTGATVPGAHGGTLVFADTTERVRRLLADDSRDRVAVTPVGREQSNTSVRVGSDHVFKLFRRLEPGEHPQIEIGRFLVRVGFQAAPPLEGSITYIARHGQSCALGAVEGWIENTGDGWSDVVAALSRQPFDRAAEEQLAARISVLGATTAEFHRAMSSDPTSLTFAPEPITENDRRLWRQSLTRQFERVVALLRHLCGEWDATTAAAARQVVDAASDAKSRAWQLAEGELPGHHHKIRIHGDFHLGQTLRTRDGFVLIDFEGEPTKPIGDRRQRQSALRDVAGMLRSLEYAVAAARATAADPASRLSATRLRRGFLDGYFARAPTKHSSLLPPPGGVDAWIRFFEFEKALYEVEYEANNRPSWVHIPLAAVVASLAPSDPHAPGDV